MERWINRTLTKSLVAIFYSLLRANKGAKAIKGYKTSPHQRKSKGLNLAI